jgi:hypothetical protein
MDVYSLYSLFVLSCVGNGIATGLIPLPGILPAVNMIDSSTLIVMRKRPVGLTRKEKGE